MQWAWFCALGHVIWLGDSPWVWKYGGGGAVAAWIAVAPRAMTLSCATTPLPQFPDPWAALFCTYFCLFHQLVWCWLYAENTASNIFQHYFILWKSSISDLITKYTYTFLFKGRLYQLMSSLTKKKPTWKLLQWIKILLSLMINQLPQLEWLAVLLMLREESVRKKLLNCINNLMIRYVILLKSKTCLKTWSINT